MANLPPCCSVLMTDDSILDYQVPPLHEKYYERSEPNPDGSAPAIPFRSIMELQPTPMATGRQLPHQFRCVLFSSGMWHH